VATGFASGLLIGWLDGMTLYAQAYIGDPGPAGTANVAGMTSRALLAFSGAAIVGSTVTRTQSGTAALAAWSGGTQTLTHTGLWTAASGGTFRGSFANSTPRDVVNSDVVTWAGIKLILTGLAA
jgi:hypothetical protein